ncbi:MAG: PD-(D/E)XK nuclease family protein [Candidatus Micrarchaeota archaeon]
MYKLSPSSLSLLKDCPRCFWLRFRKKVKRPEGIFPSLPSGMDKILKEHFDRFRAAGKLPPELSKLDGQVKLFDDMKLLSDWRNNFKGIQWKDSEGNLFRGAVDEILQKGSRLIILDFKTRGFERDESTLGYYQDQLDIYNLLFRKNGYKTEEYSYLLFYMPDKVDEKGEVLFNRELVQMRIDVGNAERIFKESLAVLAGEMPEPDAECEYCRWAKEWE